MTVCKSSQKKSDTFLKKKKSDRYHKNVNLITKQTTEQLKLRDLAIRKEILSAFSIFFFGESHGMIKEIAYKKSPN